MILRSHGTEVRIANLSVGQLLDAAGQLRGGTGGIGVNTKSVSGLTAVGRAISIASEAVARRQIGVWRGDESSKQRVMATWQARFFRGMPNERESWFDILEFTEASLTGRHNALWIKARNELGQVASVYFSPRERFEARWNKDTRRAEYRVRAGDGSAAWTDWMDSSEVVHFRIGHVEPGSVIAPTPIEVFRDALKAALSKVRFEAKHYDGGIMNSIAVTFPANVKPEQARRFRDMMATEHGGVEKSDGVRVFGNGATVSNIGVSLADAQFIESMNFDIEQVSRMYRVTSSLLGGATGVNVRTAPTPEHEEDRWFRYGLEPRLTRIEETLRRDVDFFGIGSRDFPGFLPAAIRSDAETESSMIVHEVQAGVITPNEARARKGMAPHPDGDVLQITPVGGAENPGLTGDVPAPAPAPQENSREPFLFEFRDARAPQPITINLEPSAAPDVRVNVEPTKVENAITVEPTPITVTVDPTPVTVENNVRAGDVTVEPAPVTVHAVVSEPKRKVSFKRNMQGLIDGAEVEDA